MQRSFPDLSKNAHGDRNVSGYIRDYRSERGALEKRCVCVGVSYSEALYIIRHVLFEWSLKE